MSTPCTRFKQAARLEAPEQVPVALIVDSSRLPGYAGFDALDYYLMPDRWLKSNLGLLDRFPDAAWVPGFWNVAPLDLGVRGTPEEVEAAARAASIRQRPAAA